MGRDARLLAVVDDYGHTDADAAGNITATNWNLGGSWNFGMAKVSGFYGSIDISGLAAGDVKQDNWFIRVSAPIGQWNVKASYGQVKQGHRRRQQSQPVRHRR